VDVITGYTTDGRIAAFDLVVLGDPLQAMPPYDAVLLLSPEAAADPGVITTLQPLINAISAEEMRRANMMVDVEGLEVTAAARFVNDRIAR
jgi:osmoprotectant transport system permease protein